jgi:hypothetical protein
MTPHFTDYELLRSATAERDPVLRAAQFEPPEEVLSNLQYLADTVLEPVRVWLGHPIRVTSGYRSPDVNAAVGGSKTSDHLWGKAADLQMADSFMSSPRVIGIRTEILKRTGRSAMANVNANYYLFAALAIRLDRFDIDQLIHEYGDRPGRPAWVHVSASKDRDRRQMLSIGSYTGKRYVQVSLPEVLAMGVKP